MRFLKLIEGLEHLDLIVFDNNALVVFQNGPMHKDDITIELLPLLKDAQRLELFRPREGQVVVDGKRILLRQIGEFTLAVFLADQEKGEATRLDALRLFYRLKPELT